MENSSRRLPIGEEGFASMIAWARASGATFKDQRKSTLALKKSGNGKKPNAVI
jgi:hypothetical protein